MGGGATIRIGEVGGTLYEGIDYLWIDGASVSVDRRAATLTITGGGGGVPTSRTISTTAPLAGGGDLSANRTLSLNYGSGLALSGSSLVVDTTTIATRAFATAEAAAAYAAAVAASQPLDADLTALAALTATGLLVRTGAATYAARTLQAGSGVAIVDADGIGGDPTISFSGGTNEDFDASKGRTFWLQPAGAGVLAEGTTVSYGAGAPSDGSTTTAPMAAFTVSTTGGKSMMSGLHAKLGYEGTLSCRFSTDATSNVRYFIALTATATGATPPPANCVGLVYDSGVNANWRMVATSSPSSNVTYKDLGVAPVIGDIYRVEIVTTLTTATLTLYNLTAGTDVSATIDTALGEYLPGTSSNLMFNFAAVSISGAPTKTLYFRGARYRAQYTP